MTRIRFNLTYGLLAASLALWNAVPAAHAQQVSAAVAAQARDVLRQHCFDCHGGRRNSGGVKILDHALLLKKNKIVPGKPAESPLFQLITAQDETVMPPQGRDRLSAAAVETIRLWIAAGAPAFPADAPAAAARTQAAGGAAPRANASSDYVLQSILAHVRRVPDRTRPFVRYFSCNHLLAEGVKPEDLEVERDALAKAINHLSWEKSLIRPRAIESTRTVYAVDIRTLGWDKQPLFRVRQGRAAERSTLNLFDLVLLEYPYGTIPESSVVYAQLAAEFLVPANQVRPIPYVRADWFASMATQPPLYHDLMQLPSQLTELETLLGVNAQDNVDRFRARRAGVTVSGVSHNNRVLERHPTRFGAYWKSFDFRTSRGDENIFRNPIQLNASGGEMVFNLPNGLQGYFVTDAKGRRVDLAPTDIVTDKFAQDKTVRNGLACMRCHDQGVKTFTDVVHPSMLRVASGASDFNKRQVLQLYPGQAEMGRLVKDDTDRFLAAVTALLGRPQTREPLIPVSQRFLESPLRLSTAAAELGLTGPQGLQYVFGTAELAGLGLSPLSTNGAIQRDMWEAYQDQVVRSMSLGIPMAPMDSVARRELQPNPAFNVEIQTIENKSKKQKSVFALKDELVVQVVNRSAADLHVEIIATNAGGRKAVLTARPALVRAGQTFRFPATGGIEIKPGSSKQQLSVLASERDFPAGEVVRGRDVADRVVHSFYQIRQNGARLGIAFVPGNMVKKTAEIEIR